MYIYNKQNNTVDEQKRMEHPGFPSGQIEEFKKHMASLKSYPISGTHSWEDKQELQEGKDFYIGAEDLPFEEGFAFPFIPIIKQESEDDMWYEVYKIMQDTNWKDVLQNLEQFTITRKNQ